MADKVEGAAQAAESAPGMPQLDFSTFPNQIFWLVVTLIVLYLVLSRVALPRIATVLSERHGAIQRDLDKAEEMKRSAIEAENRGLVDELSARCSNVPTKKKAADK